MQNRVITAFGRKQLLNAVYGKEPDPATRNLFPWFWQNSRTSGTRVPIKRI